MTTGRDGAERVVTESATYFAKYRDHDSTVRVVPTGCRDRQAAERVLSDLLRQADRIRAGVHSADEVARAARQQLPIQTHVDDDLLHLEAEGRSDEHIKTRRGELGRLVRDCGFHTLAALTRDRLERWMVDRARESGKARARNSYAIAAKAFAYWCCDPTVNRLASNPFARMKLADEEADPRRPRRALTEDQLARLIDTAWAQPLRDVLTVRRGKHKGEALASVRPEVHERMEQLWRERALIFRTLLMTGLRRGELASVTVGNVHLDDAEPGLFVAASGTKNQKPAHIPLRPDLADELRVWLADRLAGAQAAAAGRGLPLPLRLPGDLPLFDVPDRLSSILNPLVRQAGVAKVDDRGHRVDVHAFRKSFGTHLAKGNVHPRVAMRMMRHSQVDLTMKL